MGCDAVTDFEYGDGHYDRTRELYERLLKRTEHVKVWISYAEFETAIMDTADPARRDRVRRVYERAEQSLKARNMSEEVRGAVLARPAPPPPRDRW